MNTTEGSDLILSEIETVAYESLPNSSFSRKTKQEISNSVFQYAPGWSIFIFSADWKLSILMTVLTTTVKGGMSLRNGMWHDLRNGIIRRDAINAE